MLLSSEFILVKEITSNVPRSNFNKSDIQELAELILEAEGVIRPITVRPTGIDSYEVIDGHLEYWAAVRAKEINPRDGERIGAFVVEGKKAEAIEKQVKLLNKIHSTPPEKQQQDTAQKIETEPVTAEPEKVNLLTVTGTQLKKEFKRNKIKWTNQIWSVVRHWRSSTKKLSWDNLEKSAKPGPHKIGGFGMGTIKNLRRVGYIPV